jgi:hypothetical protein
MENQGVQGTGCPTEYELDSGGLVEKERERERETDREGGVPVMSFCELGNESLGSLNEHQIHKKHLIILTACPVRSVASS